MRLTRRTFAIAAPALLAACQQTPKVYDLKVTRDVGCVCCHGWADAMTATGRFRVSLFDAGDPSAFKQSVGVPADLAGCHTAMIERFIVEGHVPAADILRLVAEKPKGVLGLAVPGMPRGSPGMGQPNGVRDVFTVWAFEAGGARHAFASYPA